jgi:DNA (cytosine-5)-methyltransferase 1
MVKYSCERCGKEFSQKSHYDSHNRRKTPCENNTEKNKGNVYKVIEEKLNNKKLLVENEEVNVNTYIMKQQSQTKKNEINNKLKFIDLCCGIGGFHYALKNLGYECVMASDINEHCRLNYEENHKIKPLGDLTKIDVETIPRFDILCAGFPCFVAGTKVLTHNGYKNIEDVVLIDTLMSHTGKFQKILNLQHKIYNGILYNIKAKYHPSFKCTDEHPFYVREKTQKWNNKLRKYEYTFKIPEWKKAYELDNNHYFGMKINQNSIIPEFNFDKKINKHKVNTINIKLDVLDMWFMMGYFIGDGWIEETNKSNGCSMNKIRFAINTKDENDILPRINNILQITDKNCPTGNNCNKYGCSDFVWFNIFKQFGKYAHGKLIPEWVQDAPTEYIQEFVNGYHIADGCITKNDCYEFTTVSYNLAFGLQRLYLKLGHLFGINKYIRPKTTIIEERTVNQRDTYHIRGYIKERKKNHSSFIENGYVWYAPSKIEKVNVENEPVYNFEVENDNSYVIENIISHNCQPFSKAGERKGFQDERGNIFFDICKIIKYHNPKYIILENVRNLASHDGGNTWDVIRGSIEELNYHTYEYPVILNTLYFGVPQSRERVVIMCKRKDLGDLPKLPPISKNNIKSTTLEEIVDDNVHEKYNISGKLKVTEKVWSNFLDICALNNIMIPRFPIWTDWWDSDGDNTKMTKYNKKLSEEENKAKNKKDQEDFYKKYKNWIDKNREFYNENIGVLKPWLTESRNNALWVGAVRKMEWQTGTDNLKMNQVLWSPRGSGVRIKNINYSPTLVAMASMIPIYGPKSRYLTPRECAKLQSFPEEYILHKEDKVSYSQFGNAVNE